MGKTPCCDNEGMKKGPWTPEEDQKLVNYIQRHGPGRWRNLPKHAGLKRCGKSCRLRWTNYLRPDIKRGRFTFEEEEAIIQLHSVLGNKWSAIAARFPGRTDNEIKNYWNTHIKKRLLKMGIDPVTHSPRLDLLELSSILNSSLYNSSQLNIPNLLGLNSVLNPNLLSLAAALLSSSQLRNTDPMLQKLQQNLVGNHTHLSQNNFADSEQDNLNHIEGILQNQLHEIQSCTTSGTTNSPLLSVTQPMQASMEQICPNISNFSYQISQPSFWDNNEKLPNLARSPVQNYDPSVMNNNTSSNNQAYISDNSDDFQNLSFNSLLSTPSSQQQLTPLNSSSTTHVSGTSEDEMSSYCSNIFTFDMPESLDVHGIL